MATRASRRSVIKSFVDLACGSFGAVVLLAISLIRLSAANTAAERTDARLVATTESLPGWLIQNRQSVQVRCLLDGRELTAIEPSPVDEFVWQFAAEDAGDVVMVNVLLDRDEERAVIDLQGAQMRSPHTVSIQLRSDSFSTTEQGTVWSGRCGLLVAGSAFTAAVLEECKHRSVLVAEQREMPNNTLILDVRLNAARTTFDDTFSLRLQNR